jgi:pimeloyl-ACP methyl ester carboxylesterase
VLRRILKICSIVLVILLIGIYAAFVHFTAPKSTPEILKSFESSQVTPVITSEKFKDFAYRKIEIPKDSTLPTIVFVHGTIGSLNDYARYLSDSILQQHFNMISYDRIGYNYKDVNSTQESIAFEREMLLDIVNNLPKENCILVGYSYGGPIVLSVKDQLKKIVLLAPAVYSKVEPMPWMLNFYKWSATRWAVPKVWREASKEKMSHKADLRNFENNWKSTSNSVISIHGVDDWIVPFENSEFLERQFSESQFELIPLKEASHALLWTHFDVIKEQLLNLKD